MNTKNRIFYCKKFAQEINKPGEIESYGKLCGLQRNDIIISIERIIDQSIDIRKMFFLITIIKLIAKYENCSDRKNE